MSDGTPKKKRGLAALSPERRREIASKGGKTSHAKGTAHEYNTATARQAGRKGGQATSKDREHMSRIGRMGGEARSNQPRGLMKLIRSEDT